MSVFDGMSEMRADYDIARENRYRRQKIGVPPYGVSGDFHFRSPSLAVTCERLFCSFTRNFWPSAAVYEKM